MKKSVVVFSFSVAAIILSLLIFSILAILFFYWGNSNAVKDSLSTVSGIFGGITTIGAAVVAAYLFNDWKEQHNRTIIASEAKEAFSCIHSEVEVIRKINRRLQDKKNALFGNIKMIENDDVEQLHQLLAETISTNQTKLSEFTVLIKGHALFETLTLYYIAVNNLNDKRLEWRENGKNYDDEMNTYELMVLNLLNDNFTILNKLTSFILFEET